MSHNVKTIQVKTIHIAPITITTLPVEQRAIGPGALRLCPSGPCLEPMPTDPTPGLNLPTTKVKTLRINRKGDVLDGLGSNRR